MRTDLDSLQEVHLIMVAVGEETQSNKYYNMTKLPGGSEFESHWGRVGLNDGKKKTYPIHKFNSTYKEKVQKGYKDVTDLKIIEETKSVNISANAIVYSPEELFSIDCSKLFQSYAKETISKIYLAKSESVTEKQIKEAQTLLNSLTLFKEGSDTKAINSNLIDLYSVIPRKMKNVRDHIFDFQVLDSNDKLQLLLKIIEDEQTYLDAMSGQVQTNTITSDSIKNEFEILAEMGIQINSINHDEEILIKKLMADHSLQFSKAWKIENVNTRNKFENFKESSSNKKLEIFWHGSRNENWWNIMNTGLVLRPTSAVITGAMWGKGLYFADKFKKSLGYTSYSGSYWAKGNSKKAYLALFDVHTGNQLKASKHNSSYYNYDETILKSKGDYHSLFAQGGYDLVNNEFIVYNESQSTIKYIVEVQ